MKSSLPFLVERILKPQSIEDESRLNNDEKVKLLSKRLAQLLDLGVTGYFLLSVEPSVLSKSGNYALYLSEGGLSLPYRRYEQSDSTDAYLDYISKLLAAFSADVRGIKDKRIGEIEDDAKQRAAEVLKMEQDMKSISLTPEQKRDKKLTTNLKPYDVSNGSWRMNR